MKIEIIDKTIMDTIFEQCRLKFDGLAITMESMEEKIPETVITIYVREIGEE